MAYQALLHYFILFLQLFERDRVGIIASIVLIKETASQWAKDKPGLEHETLLSSIYAASLHKIQKKNRLKKCHKEKYVKR